MSRRTVVLSLFLASLLAVTSAGQAIAGAPRTHDGFFLRLSAGGGSAKTELDVPGQKIEIDGESGDVNIAIGGIVAENLALHGTLFGWATSDPEVEIEGLGSGTANGDLGLSAIGVGLTYYFMPVNMYLSGSVGSGKLSIDTPLGDADSDRGVVGDLTLGKEWWLGGNWGLGLSGSFGFHSIPDGSVDENWTGNSFALRLSATLN